MERRRNERQARYFPLRYGDGESEFQALTRDLSSGGLFVATTDLQPPGARLWFELLVEPQRPLYFEGVVVRQQKGRATRRDESGFAVRFLSAAEVLARYLTPTTSSPKAAVQLTFDTQPDFERALERGLLNGQTFTWSTLEQPLGERLRLEVSLPFKRRSAELTATVTQVVADGARFGLALALDDAGQLRDLARE